MAEQRQAPGGYGPTPPRNPAPVRSGLARALITYEAVWSALAPAIGVLALFVALALSDWLPMLPGWLHLLVLVAFGAGFLGLLARGVRRIRLPGAGRARRRLEVDSGLAHRPLGGLADRPAGGPDPVSAALWRRHQDSLRASIQRLALTPPRPVVAGRDRYGVMGAVALCLVVALVAGAGDWRARVQAAVSPGVLIGQAAVPPVLDLFITPPVYTRQAPLFLTAGELDRVPLAEGEAEMPAIEVPEGSAILARVSGGRGTPELTVGGQISPFETGEGGVHEAMVTVDTPGVKPLTVRARSGVLGQWRLVVAPDQAPVVTFAEPPAATAQRALSMKAQVTDDYGVERMVAVIRPAAVAEAEARGDVRPEGVGGPLIDAAVEIEFGLPAPESGTVDAAAFPDLTPHPLAGQEVEITLVATDGAGHTGRSDPVTMVLPERVFTHPIARAVAEARRRLIASRSHWSEVAETLEILASRPERFSDDLTVFLGMMSASRRIEASRDPRADVHPVEQLLWQLALRLEDGDIALAESRLRDAQEALMQALADGADDAEIERLIDEVRAALAEYLEALAEQARNLAAQQPDAMPFDPAQQAIAAQDLQRMVDRMLDDIGDLSETGAREQAQALLNQLRELTESLQSGNFAQGQQENPAMDLAEDLQDLMAAQQQLLDQTFREAEQNRFRPPSPQFGQQFGQQQQQGQQGAPRPNTAPGQRGPGQPGRSGVEGNEGAQIQNALRRALGDTMLELGEMLGSIPDPLGRAERFMRQAEDALGRGDAGDAVGPQTGAIEELQQGLEEFVDQMMEQMAQQNSGQAMPGRADSPGTDPLGRQEAGRGGRLSEDIEVPTGGEVQRSRDIVRELRRRLGERSRPELERDYLERLLRRF